MFIVLSLLLLLSLLISSSNGYKLSSLKSSRRNENIRILSSSTFETFISPETTTTTSSSSSSSSSSDDSTTTSLPYLAERRPLKTAILALAARTKRGEIATSSEKELMSELVSKLESYNPIENPCQNEKSLGKWELIYSNTNLFRSSPFFMAARAVCKTEIEAERFNLFCDLHRDALSFTNMGKITQVVTETSLTSEFETFVPIIAGLPIIIKGTIMSNSEIVTKLNNSWIIMMDKVRIKENTSNIPILNNLLDQFTGLPIRQLGNTLENIVNGYTNPKPEFRCYYIDTHMRISRDQDDNIFVYNRV